ncbi:conserved hypothetical protein [Rhodospirillaceae bacterium LM-1]|nr:conserved hypothetical protein [Rhodospirillaceae bacterium LM-1]
MLKEILFCLQEAPHMRHGWRVAAEQAAIHARFRRHPEEWGTHLAICRELVREAALGCKRGGCAAVLGSGLLLDVPLEELCQRFERVLLIDLHHPRSARQAGKRHANLVLRHADVTKPGFWGHLAQEADFVVSLNLAAQLALAAGGEQAARNHALMLKSWPGGSMMISEFARVELDVEGREIAREPALALGHDFDLPEKLWKWYLAPPGELAPYRGLALEIGAWKWRV